MEIFEGFESDFSFFWEEEEDGFSIHSSILQMVIIEYDDGYYEYDDYIYILYCEYVDYYSFYMVMMILSLMNYCSNVGILYCEYVDYYSFYMVMMILSLMNYCSCLRFLFFLGVGRNQGFQKPSTQYQTASASVLDDTLPETNISR